MGRTKFTNFGLCVKKRLLDLGMTQRQLERRVSQDTGLYVDAGYLYKILTGKREAPKVTASIEKILDIPYL